MKRLHLLNIFLTGLILAFAVLNAFGQPRGGPPPDGGNQFAQQNRPKLLEELNLSKEQIQQIRRINAERKLIMQESKRRFDAANLALDESIYGDKGDEAEIQARLRDAQLAHAEMIKNRTISETAIRRVLTPTQLTRFRELRQQFNPQKREINQEQRQINNQQQPPNRLKNLPKRQILRQQQRPPK